jgi:hypothetical protein
MSIKKQEHETNTIFNLCAVIVILFSPGLRKSISGNPGFEMDRPDLSLFRKDFVLAE